MRNLLAHAGRQGRGVAGSFIATAFVQNDAATAKAQQRKAADQLRSKLPKLAAAMDEVEVDVLACMDFSAAPLRVDALSPGQSTVPRLTMLLHPVGVSSSEREIQWLSTEKQGGLLNENGDVLRAGSGYHLGHRLIASQAPCTAMKGEDVEAFSAQQ